MVLRITGNVYCGGIPMTEIDTIIDSFDITKVKERDAGGTRVTGTFEGYEFESLVFAEHAENEGYELRNSRISKLWIRRISDNKTVFNWDRGMNIDAADDTVKVMVDFLCSGLADAIFLE
jgi:hypothetical protein